jgi:hypothetical protein
MGWLVEHHRPVWVEDMGVQRLHERGRAESAQRLTVAADDLLGRGVRSPAALATSGNRPLLVAWSTLLGEGTPRGIPAKSASRPARMGRWVSLVGSATAAERRMAAAESSRTNPSRSRPHRKPNTVVAVARKRVAVGARLTDREPRRVASSAQGTDRSKDAVEFISCEQD